MDDIKISIIIPVFNVSKYIERCLLSVMNQTNTKGIECILVDDKTPDDSIKIAQNLLANYQGNINFRLVEHRENKGLAAARNTGIKKAIGEYVYFLDSDDEITADCMEGLLKLIERYKGIELIQADVLVRGSDFMQRHLELKCDLLPDYTDDKCWIKDSLLTRGFIAETAWNKLIKRTFLLEHDLFFKENIIHEDIHWTFFLAKCVRTMAFSKLSSYVYYINPNTITTNINKVRESNSRWLIIKDMVVYLDDQCVESQKRYILSYYIFSYKYLCHNDKSNDSFVMKQILSKSNLIQSVILNLWYYSPEIFKRNPFFQRRVVNFYTIK